MGQIADSRAAMVGRYRRFVNRALAAPVFRVVFLKPRRIGLIRRVSWRLNVRSAAP